MKASLHGITKGRVLALAGALFALGLLIAGCTSSLAPTASTVTSLRTTVVPVSVTDAPADPVLALKLTINSIVLTDSSGKTASLLSSPAAFEAVHMDAVQEPFFTPPIPQDTYTSVTISYSNAVVSYIDPTTGHVDVATVTPTTSSYTDTFSSPVTVGSSPTSLLFDLLVANSVTISSSTVTVTPEFNVSVVPIPPAPTNGVNGLMCGYKGMVTAIGTNNFTITDGNGNTQIVYVNASTVYQGISGFSALQVNALVEVDTATQTDGTLLAQRVEVDDPGTAPKLQLVGPVTSVTGSPATSFNMLVRQQLGQGTTNATPLQTVDVTIDGSTTFQLPPRYNALATAPPFVPTFNASTIFAGQHVGVITTSTTEGTTATASAVLLQPQTVDGTIASIGNSGGYTVFTLTLSSTSWLAKLTGQTTVTVYTNGQCQPINTTAPAVGGQMRFNGFLFNVNGSLTLLADVQAGPPGAPIGPPMG
jgi:hypothetical protein